IQFRLRCHERYPNCPRSHRGSRTAGPDLGERRPSRLVATAAENRCGVELQMPKASAGRFTQQALRFGLSGYLSAGHAALFDWKAATPWWISSFVPNLEAELGLALMFASGSRLAQRHWRNG